MSGQTPPVSDADLRAALGAAAERLDLDAVRRAISTARGTQEAPMPESTQPYVVPDGERYFLDADGFAWREVWLNGEVRHSMARVNPDNSPTPEPLTYLTPVARRDHRVVCDKGHVRSQSYDGQHDERARLWDASCGCGGPHVIEHRDMGPWTPPGPAGKGTSDD